ncbi:maleylpyruvate isomerase N-terminal domain-containing protein [Cellulomonas sp. PhB143]|uniref:maleylpyruvate isomerase N-terminal domain-containing protein n=1 Tax=Cellulomonas sp. PhB143 TaxID=2485186 RepID=UPI000F4A72F8|nr:maleylpyruvate isomerase N-terminal domain-containing protein [Cellulomonas sp. PhB143]
MTADLRELTEALHAQWQALSAWLREADLDDDALESPSVLPGWSVGALVTHLGRVMDTLAAAGPVPPGTVPMSLAEYLGTYPQRAEEIAEATRALDARTRGDRLGAADGAAARGFAALDRLAAADDVVQARRGPLTLRDMVASRVVELVVHADDLDRSLPGVSGSPRDRGALDLAAAELLAIVVARGGWHVEIEDPLTWVRLAAGRAAYDVDVLARALRPEFTAGGVPDLGRVLPVL